MASKTKLTSAKGSKTQSPTPSSTSMSSQGPGRKGGKSRDGPKPKDDEKLTLAFKVLSASDTKLLAAIDDVDDLQQKMQEVLQMMNPATDLKEGALLDYYVSAFWWGKEQNFTEEQVSAHFTVVHNTIQNVKEKQMPLNENLKEFRKCLVGIGADIADSPGGGLQDIFDVNQAKLITDYMYTSIFQHYKLYEFMLGHSQAEEIIGTDLEVEVPFAASMPWPPPLDEGVTESIHQEYIATPPPTPVQEELAEGQTDEATDDAVDPEGGGDGESTEAGREADLMAQLTTQEIQAIMDSVFEETLGGLKTEVAAKLRDKENAFINRINKIHNAAETS